MIRRLIVIALERVCTVVDCHVPGVRRVLGCPRGMAMWSSMLDERWKAGVWRDVES